MLIHRVYAVWKDSTPLQMPSKEGWETLAIYQYVFALAHGAGNQLFYYGDWIRKPGVAICSCNDGLRPVIFKLEATDEEAEIDYTPVKDRFDK